MNRDTRSAIDEFEARCQFDDLLDQVERGAEFVITRRGNVVARLIAPPHLASPHFAGSEKRDE
jgi:antitoxin (DNA-binding transcriptional repressor) of toxin-antitoxin stability system